MSKPIVYIAHPVSGDVEANLARVTRWIKALLEHDPSRVYIAPWVGEVTAYLGGFPPGGYDRVLEDDQAVVARLDGLIAVGGTWSRGMKLEMAVATDVMDWTEFTEPSEVPDETWTELADSTFGRYPGADIGDQPVPF